MFLLQELYYITKGTYRRRKSMTVVYQVANNGVRFVDALEGEPSEVMHVIMRLYGNVFQTLPSIETTPSRYRDFMSMKKAKTRG